MPTRIAHPHNSHTHTHLSQLDRHHSKDLRALQVDVKGHLEFHVADGNGLGWNLRAKGKEEAQEWAAVLNQWRKYYHGHVHEPHR